VRGRSTENTNTGQKTSETRTRSPIQLENPPHYDLNDDTRHEDKSGTNNVSCSIRVKMRRNLQLRKAIIP
jgi:hypothetical protein